MDEEYTLAGEKKKAENEERQRKSREMALMISDFIQDLTGLKVFLDRSGDPNIMFFFLTKDQNGDWAVYHSGKVSEEVMEVVKTDMVSRVSDMVIDDLLGNAGFQSTPTEVKKDAT